MGCQRSIAEKIVAKKADYILAVKENQGNLLAEIKDSFQMLAADGVKEEIDCGHGRVERRRCSVIADLSLLENASEWASLKGLVRIESERYHKATGKTETRNPLLHHQPRSRRGAAKSGYSQPLGHRKQAPLGPRCQLRRRPGPQTRRQCRAELLDPQSNRPQPAQTGQNLQARNQRQATQSWLGQRIPAAATRKLRCVGPALSPHPSNLPIAMKVY